MINFVLDSEMQAELFLSNWQFLQQLIFITKHLSSLFLMQNKHHNESEHV